MNINKLKGKLRECNVTYEKAAECLNLSIASFNNKMNEKSKFYIDEIDKLSKFLNLTDSEIIEIFLS